MQERTIKTVVVGSGCAGFNAADWLLMLGETDIALVTDGITHGTSRNTGSDKQTYYKLSLAGDEGDSVGEMAQTLKHPDVDGDIALCEAASSAACFLRLAALGVPFPQNEYGEYVGYQTDHDTRKRASSAGPLTSRMMTEALEAAALAKGLRILDSTLAVRVLKDADGVCGLLCYDLSAQDWLHIHCANVVLCTGGPAHIYLDRVYPDSQFGMSSLALEAGASGANLHCWQYGLASVAFRWNVSGSYQQALPRYVSIDTQGIEHDFLSQALGEKQALNMIFLKGYQWPFDPRKMDGSSQVDMLVKRETDQGRRVFLDYRRNPTGFSYDALSDEARDYLCQCHALQPTPIKRLSAINTPAIELYQAHGIDLKAEMLEIRVCVQHHNGGIAVDSNWQTDIPGLYACGEAAGTFGQFRPGGSALNSTQVGSMRAAKHIARSRRPMPTSQMPPALPLLPPGDAVAATQRFQADMSRWATFIRSADGMDTLLQNGAALLRQCGPASLNDPQLVSRLRLRDILITQQQVLSAMKYAMSRAGEGVLITCNGQSSLRAAHPLPTRDLWFERVWRREQVQE